MVFPHLEKEMSLATPIPLVRLCRLAHVSRAGYYRWQSSPPAIDAELDLRDEIQRIALEFPSYGWPRITAELKRRGWKANHKRVYRIMREDNLLCLRRRKFVVTTDSNHHRPVYPNLARGMVLTGIDQLLRNRWEHRHVFPDRRSGEPGDGGGHDRRHRPRGDQANRAPEPPALVDRRRPRPDRRLRPARS